MRTAFLSLVLPIVASAPSALAQGTSAEDLFREGVSLFARGEVAAACERFQRSYKLDAAPGTLYNLAGCHEKQGLLWQARLDYLDLVERATAAGKLDKAKLSRERLVAVEALLPRLSLAFPPDSNVASVVIDDVPLAQGAWRDPVPVAPGTHVIEFRAPGKASVKKTLATPAVAVSNVDVPILPPESTSPAMSAAVSPTGVPAATEAHSSGVNGRLVAGLSVGVVGLAGLGVGGYFAAHAVSLKSDAATACGAPDNMCPTLADTTKAQNLSSQSGTSGIESGVAFGIGLVAVGIGLTLIATSGSSRDTAPSSANVLLTPTVGPGVGGLSLTGRF